MIEFIRKNTIVFIGFFVFLSFVQLFSYRLQNKSTYNVFDRTIIYISSPIQGFINYIQIEAVDAIETYIYLTKLSKSHQKLKHEVAKLKQQLFATTESELQNQRLKKLLSFKYMSPWKSVTGEIIARGRPGRGQTIKLNLGQNDGVAVNNAVVSYDGVVGKVISVTQTYSDVLLIIDSNSAVDVLCQRSRVNGIIQGQQTDPLRLNLLYVENNTDIVTTDILITSGLGGVWPKGIRVGTVQTVKKTANGLFQDVTVTPFVNFYKLEEVMVIIE